MIMFLWGKFTSWKNKELKIYITAILGKNMLMYVRGQSSSGLKIVFYAFLPAMVIFLLGSTNVIQRKKCLDQIINKSDVRYDNHIEDKI